MTVSTGGIIATEEATPLSVSLNRTPLRIPSLGAFPAINLRPYNPAAFIKDSELPPATFDQSPYGFSSGVNQFFVLKRAVAAAAGGSNTTNATSSASSNLLKEGSSGESVRKVQERLKALGFPVGVTDGKFGNQTEEAVKLFQASKGLKPDGIIGEQTLKALTETVTPAPAPTETQPNAISEPQKVRDLLASIGVRDLSYMKTTEGLKAKVEPVDSLSNLLTVTNGQGESFQFMVPVDNFKQSKAPSPTTQAVVAQEQAATGFTAAAPVANLPVTNDIPTEWKFVVAPASISWSRAGNVSKDSPYGTNKQLVNYSSTSMRTLSLGEVLIEGFSTGKSVESKIRSLERCMDVERNQQGFISPYVWELFGIGKSYGYYLITNVSVAEMLRDDRGNATRAMVSIELTEVPKFQVYNGRDLARPNDLVKPNFCMSEPPATDAAAAAGGTPTTPSSGVPVTSEPALKEAGFKGSLQFIKEKEKFSAEPYDDVGKLSVGYGTRDTYLDSNGNPVKITSATRMTEPEANASLMRTFSKNFLPSLKKIPHWDEMSPCQQSALASFTWNLGADSLSSPSSNFATIQRALSNKSNWKNVPNALMLYNKAGGRAVGGLTTRRAEEGKLWNQC